MTWGYNVGGNSDEPSTALKFIPANEARPLRDDPAAFTSELSWGIKVVDDVYDLAELAQIIHQLIQQ